MVGAAGVCSWFFHPLQPSPGRRSEYCHLLEHNNVATTGTRRNSPSSADTTHATERTRCSNAETPLSGSTTPQPRAAGPSATVTCRCGIPHLREQEWSKIASRRLVRPVNSADQVHVSTNQIAQTTMTPPPRSVVGPEYGYACDPSHQAPGPDDRPSLPKPHEGCPGWWPDASNSADADGWRCRCTCHELWAGWPGHESYSAN